MARTEWALRWWEFYDEIYGVTYLVLRGDSGEARKHLKKRYGLTDVGEEEFNEGNAAGFTSLIATKTGPVIYLWFPSFEPWNADHLATLAHETLHTVTIVFNRAGVPIDEEHDEPAAYYLGWVFRECCSRLMEEA